MQINDQLVTAIYFGNSRVARLKFTIVKGTYMEATHLQTIQKYEPIRDQARDIASRALPQHLRGMLRLSAVDFRAIAAFNILDATQEREVDWNWNFASRYSKVYPKAFDLSVWHGNSLCSLTLGRPTYKGTAMRMDFIERFTKNPLFKGDMYQVSLLAYATYGRLIGANQIRIMDPQNAKLIKHYSSEGGFEYKPAKKGVCHYLVRDL